MIRSAAALLFISFFISCTSCPPEWYTNLPQAEGYIYAVGYSDPTYIESDAVGNAEMAARSEFARVKKSHVRNIGEYYSSDSGSFGEERSVVESDTDITGAEVVKKHVCDDSWRHEYSVGTCFILMRIEESRLFTR